MNSDASWFGARHAIACVMGFCETAMHMISCARSRSFVVFLFLAVAGFSGASARATIAFVQVANTTTNTASSSINITYAAAQGAADLNVVVVGWEDSTSNIASVVDSRGNSYALAVGPVRNTGHNSLAIYYAKNIVAATAGSNTVTVTFNTAAAGPDIRVAEYSGLDTGAPFDVASSGLATSGTAMTTGTMTTSSANELIVGADQLSQWTSAVGAGFTQRVNTSHGHVLEDRIVTSFGNYTASATQGASGFWTMIGAAFRAASTDTTAPTTPTSVGATAVSASQINLSWAASTDNIAVTGYRVERCAGASCTSFVEIAAPTGTTFSDTGLTASTTYRYRIRAQDAVPNFSGYSSIASATTSASPTIAFVQVANATTNTASSSVAITYASAQHVGGLNVVVVGWEDDTSNITSVADTKGNSYALAVGPVRNTGHNSLAIYYAKSILAATAGSNTVTVTFNTAAAGPDIRIAEYSGLDTTSPFDVASSGLATSGTAMTTGTMTTTSANELIVGADQLSQWTSAVGAGFTQRVSTSHGHVLEDRIVTSLGAYTADATQGASGFWTMIGATFRVAGSGGGGGGGDTTAPTVPAGLTATAASSSQINLTWTASTDNVAVTGYRVERCQGAGCSSFIQVGTPTTNSFNDTGLSASTSYTYRVRAQDAVPNLSGYSSTATATTSASGDTQAPTAPSGLTATVVSSSQINLSWTASTDNVGVTGYRVERCVGGSGCSPFSQIGSPTATTFSDTGLSASTTYSYRVRAADAVPNLSNYSNVATAATSAPGDTQAPTTPAGLSIVAASSVEVDLVWGASTDNVGVSGYLVERCQGAGCSSWGSVATPAGLRLNNASLTPATSYSYRVSARDAAGNTSLPSAPVTYLTPANTPDCGP